MNNPSIFQLNSLSQIQPLFLVAVCRFRSGSLPKSKLIDWRRTSGHSQSFSCSNFHHFKENKKGSGRRRSAVARASTRESPYQVLGVSPSATPDEIKRAYRKLALKFHPDVNKQANAQEKFMRIKHAYNILLNKSERQAESSYSTPGRSQSRTSEDDEEFYGFGNFVTDVQITIGDFFKDLQEEFRNWEAEAASQGKPKSLWEELSEIGEDFVEFLEKELNTSDVETGGTDGQKRDASSGGSKAAGRVSETDAAGRGKEENIVDDIEATLAQLKKELGL